MNNKNLILISVKDLKKEFPDKLICRDSSFGIFDRDRIGLLGINGCGKTTLLKMLNGSESTDKGEIAVRKDINIGYLPQTPQLSPVNTIFQHVYSNPKFALLMRYHELLIRIQSNDESLSELHDLQSYLETNQIWQLEVEARKILSRFGFSDFNQKIGLLSGGQQRRIDLARILVDQPQLLLLDEPTNHLDIETIEWLQEYLISYPGSILFITHDRYFLDTVSTKIMEIENGTIRFYDGNYSNYLQAKQQEQIDLNRKETRRVAQLQKEINWLNRGAKARSSKPKDHLRRVKDLLEKSYVSKTDEMKISFQSARIGKTILEIRDISKSYDKQIIKNFTHIFQKNEKIGIIGPNGCGKTTLLNMINGNIEPDCGEIMIGQNTRVNYYSQNPPFLNQDKSILEYISECADNIKTENSLVSASQMLKRFLFADKMQTSKIKSLSGGEQKRLYLLRTLMFESNFLLMDEPTNDLDIKTLEILADFLESFQGCILIVSHDRYFLDRIVDHLFIFDEEKIINFPGNYSDYLLARRFKKDFLHDKSRSISKQRQRNSLKGLSYNEKRELSDLENRINKLETNKQELLDILTTSAAKMGKEEFSKLSEELTKLEREYELLAERWIKLEEKKNNTNEV
jgi:ATP-binding cassette subfamily F protein uup